MSAVAVLLVFVGVACENMPLEPDGTGGDPADSFTLIVEPESADVSVGDTVQFTARVVDGDDDELSGINYAWSVSDPEVADVDEEGRVVGLAQGNVEVAVEATLASGGDQSLTTEASVAVLPRTVAAVSISPSSASVQMGDTLQLSATVTDEDGEPVERTVEWASSDSAVASVDADGELVGRAEGEASVSARAASVADTTGVTVELTPAASVEVSPGSVTLGEGEMTQLGATVRDSSGNELDRSVTWSSSNTSVAAVDPLGQVQAQVEGEAVITARSGDAEGTADVVVEASSEPPAPEMPSSLSLSEASLTDSEVEYTADWSASDGADDYDWNAASETGVWSESGSGISETEVTFTAERASTDDDAFFCVRAVSDAGESDQRCTGFTVPAESEGGGGGDDGGDDGSDDGDPAAVSVSPSTAEVEVGGVTQLSATVTDDLGDVLDVAVNWSSSNTGVATVSSSGLVSGQAEGTAQITAEVDGISDGASVDVVSAGPGAGPVLVEDFSSYSSTLDLLSDPRGVFAGAEDALTSEIELDTGVGLDQGGYNLSQSMRYDFPAGGGYPQRDLEIPNTTEIWIEIWARFSTNFRTDWGQSGNPDYKWILWNAPESTRFQLKHGTFGNGLQSKEPGNDYSTFADATQYWDGQWHRWRIHWKLEDGSQANGVNEIWVDGSKVLDRRGISNNADRMVDRLSVGANMNQSQGEELHLWWGRISVWTSDPGW